jgi:hypothetical protein
MSAAELVFVDSGDHYASASLLRKWTSGGVVSITAGRQQDTLSANSQALRCSFTNAPNVTFPGGNGYASLTIGMAIKPGAFQNNFWTLTNAYVVTGSAIPSISIGNVGDGRLLMNLGGLTKIIPSIVLSTGVYSHIAVAMDFTKDGSNHPVVNYSVYYNGAATPIVTDSLTLSTTTLASTAEYKYINFALSGPGGGNNNDYDDIYVTTGDSTGNGYVGDVFIVCIYPNAAGDLAGWTPLTPGDLYLMIKEHSPDDLSTYIYSSAVNDEELDNMDDIGAFVGTVFGAQFVWCAEKTDAGVASFKGEIKTAGSTYQSDEFLPSGNSWAYFRKPYLKNPDTTNNFTVAEINAIQMGAKRIS